MADHDKIRALIAEIATQHGVALSQDDPLLILQTINAMLLGESADTQEALLRQFKNELEDLTARWVKEAKTLSESILNTALDAARATMKEHMAEAAKAIVTEVRADIGKGLDKSLSDGRAAANRNLLASGITLIAALVALFALLWTR